MTTLANISSKYLLQYTIVKMFGTNVKILGYETFHSIREILKFKKKMKEVSHEIMHLKLIRLKRVRFIEVLINR